MINFFEINKNDWIDIGQKDKYQNSLNKEIQIEKYKRINSRTWVHRKKTFFNFKKIKFF